MSQNNVSIYNLLQSTVVKKIENYDVIIEEGKLRGQNFVGEIIYSTVIHKKTNKERHFVIKQAPEHLMEIPIWKNLFVTEIHFYDNVWPILDEFQKMHLIEFDKIPTCFATSREGNNQIILEDLNYKNFQLHDKRKPLDREHFELIFESYGIYHAISYAYREFYPEEFTRLSNKLKEIQPLPNIADQKRILSPNITLNFEYVENLFDKEQDDNIIEALKKLCSEAIYYFTTARYDYGGTIPVLIHGDCWSNNMMFKYTKQGKLTDIRLLDFQRAITSSPAYDLSQSFYTGASKENLDNLDDFLKIYVNSFSATLEKFNCKPKIPITFEKMKSEWKEHSKFGLIFGIIGWRIKLTDHPADIRLKKLHTVADEDVNYMNKILVDLVKHCYENHYF